MKKLMPLLFFIILLLLICSINVIVMSETSFNLYTYNSDTGQLLQIDPQTGKAVIMHNLSEKNSFADLSSFSESGSLITVGLKSPNTQLYRINLLSGEINLIGDTGLNFVEGIEYIPSTGQLFAGGRERPHHTNNSYLFIEINPIDGSIIKQQKTNIGDIDSLAYNPVSGELWAVDSQPSRYARLWIIDLQTGQGTLRKNYPRKELMGYSGLTGISFGPDGQAYGLLYKESNVPIEGYRLIKIDMDDFSFELLPAENLGQAETMHLTNITSDYSEGTDEYYRRLTDEKILKLLPEADGDMVPFPGNRGACGAGMPSTAADWPDKAIKVLDPNNPDYCYFVVYKDIKEAGTHIGCRFHDACFDICKKKKGESYDDVREYLGPCHDACSVAVLKLFPIAHGASWMIGGGPYSEYLLFYDKCEVLGPFNSDTTIIDLISMGKIKPNTEICDNQSHPNMDLYAIEIWTGGKWGAGTDAQVYITLGYDMVMHCMETSEIALPGAPFTNKSVIDEIENQILSQSLSLSGFERNNHETYYFVRAEYLPEVNFIRLRRNNNGSFPGWYCEKVKLYKEEWNSFEKEEELADIAVKKWIGTESKKFDAK